jgi:hypothetical protein
MHAAIKEALANLIGRHGGGVATARLFGCG